ncbi:MAG TPA: hypothetical protein VKA86_12105 [Candidatus Krumholzibacteria bacterium]|nr:hypothetical protein [Candidatus Krumholzibacteria bacterium]
MRIFRERGRKRLSTRERSRFGRHSTAGGQDLIRFRRNQESLWREATSMVLWVAIAIMLLNLAGTLHRFGERHLAQRGLPIRVAFPALAVGAAAFCVWRARGGVVELVDIRREQKVISARLRAAQRDESASDA